MINWGTYWYVPDIVTDLGQKEDMAIQIQASSHDCYWEISISYYHLSDYKLSSNLGRKSLISKGLRELFTFPHSSVFFEVDSVLSRWYICFQWHNLPSMDKYIPLIIWILLFFICSVLFLQGPRGESSLGIGMRFPKKGRRFEFGGGGQWEKS